MGDTYSEVSVLDEATVELRSGDLTAVILPGLGMLGASLRHQDQELLGHVDDIAGFARQGRACGIPLLHPWANRLSTSEYRAAGRDVAVDTSSALLHRDGNGLLMHGVPWSQLAWQVESANSTSTTAWLDWNTEQLFAVFPFEHRLELTHSLDGQGLTVDLTLFAGADGPVPVSFGFHPYIRLPDLPRERWRITLPTMMHLLVDEQSIPTGDAVGFPALDAPLGQRHFDDGFALFQPYGEFSIAGGGRRIAVELVEGYDHLQIYAPVDQDQIAFEPMTAPANALIAGDGLRIVEPGDSFHARFRVAVEDIR